MTNQLWKQARDIAEMVVITALVVVFVRNVAITYTVNGPSMEPAFEEDHRVLVNRFGAIRFWGVSLYGQPDFLFEGPERGDIIVFEPQQSGTEKIVKRVVGLPGDKVDIVNGGVEVNEIATNYSDDFTDPKSHLDYPVSSFRQTTTSFWATTGVNQTIPATGDTSLPKTSSARSGCSTGPGNRSRRTESPNFKSKTSHAGISAPVNGRTLALDVS